MYYTTQQQKKRELRAHSGFLKILVTMFADAPAVVTYTLSFYNLQTLVENTHVHPLSTS